MGKKIRLEFEYEKDLVETLDVILSESIIGLLPFKINIVTRMTERDISEGSIKMIECTEIIHEN